MQRYHTDSPYRVHWRSTELSSSLKILNAGRDLRSDVPKDHPYKGTAKGAKNAYNKAIHLKTITLPHLSTVGSKACAELAVSPTCSVEVNAAMMRTCTSQVS